MEGEVGEMYDLLITVKKARDNAELRTGLQKKAAQELEAEKNHIGRESIAIGRRSIAEVMDHMRYSS